MKRNAERYKFWEPRPPVDPVWARSRRSRFSICKVQSDLNFLVTFAEKRTFGLKIAFWAYFPILGPKIDFGSKTHFCQKVRSWTQAEKTSFPQSDELPYAIKSILGIPNRYTSISFDLSLRLHCQSCQSAKTRSGEALAVGVEKTPHIDRNSCLGSH